MPHINGLVARLLVFFFPAFLVHAGTYVSPEFGQAPQKRVVVAELTAGVVGWNEGRGQVKRPQPYQEYIDPQRVLLRFGKGVRHSSALLDCLNPRTAVAASFLSRAPPIT